METVYLLYPVLCLITEIYAHNAEILYKRNIHHSDMLPEPTDANLTEFLDIRLLDCAMKCFVAGQTCPGFFHNGDIHSCKLLPVTVSDGLVFLSQTGWEFFSDNPCEIGWSHYMNNCYYLSKTETTWENAKSQCLASSAHLAEIESTEENDWVVETLAPVQCNGAWFDCVIWIGGNDRDNEGSFVWSSDSRALGFSNWSPVEPNSFTADDDCIVITYPGGKWADFGCPATRTYLCKKPLSSL